jgi:hypothetical protein
MPNYQNGRIYKITSFQTEQIYVGSTTKTLCRRMADHRSAFKKPVKNYTAFIILAFDDAFIELIENFPCNSKEELEARERHYIRTLPNVVNKVVPTRSYKEWYEENRDKILAHKREFNQNDRIQNKETINTDLREKYHENEEYRNHRLELCRKFYAKRRVERLAKNKIEMTCECGAKFQSSSKWQHEKTHKHQDFVNSKNNLNIV